MSKGSEKYCFSARNFASSSLLGTDLVAPPAKQSVAISFPSLETRQIVELLSPTSVAMKNKNFPSLRSRQRKICAGCSPAALRRLGHVRAFWAPRNQRSRLRESKSLAYRSGAPTPTTERNSTTRAGPVGAVDRVTPNRTPNISEEKSKRSPTAFTFGESRVANTPANNKDPIWAVEPRLVTPFRLGFNLRVRMWGSPTGFVFDVARRNSQRRELLPARGLMVRRAFEQPERRICD